MKIYEYQHKTDFFSSKILDRYFEGMRLGIFDIETLGLSPERAECVLAGLMKVAPDGSCTMRQYFAESAREEAQLLNKDRPEDGLFIAESPKVIGRALDAGYIPISVLVEKKQMEENEETQEVLARFENTGTSIFTAEFAVLTQLTGFKLTRGMLCALKRRPLEDFRKLCEGKNRIAILEDVMNPTNVGAIFRSAAAMHMDAVLLTSGCSNPLYRRASRVSMGTVFQIPWTFIQDDKERRCDRKEIWPVQAIESLKALGYKTAALALTDDSVSIDDPQLMSEEKLAVILGTEGDGLMQETIKACDYTVKIPMSHGVDSLNVAAASAVAFWQLRK